MKNQCLMVLNAMNFKLILISLSLENSYLHTHTPFFFNEQISNSFYAVW